MRAYTDHPITELGDIEGKPAPIRACEILSFDGSRYCEVECNDEYVYFVPVDQVYTHDGSLFTRWQLNKIPRPQWLADVTAPRNHLNS